MSIVLCALKKIIQKRKIFGSAEFIFSTIRKHTKKQDRLETLVVISGDDQPFLARVVKNENKCKGGRFDGTGPLACLNTFPFCVG